jgi:hypothetical protein
VIVERDDQRVKLGEEGDGYDKGHGIRNRGAAE